MAVKLQKSRMLASAIFNDNTLDAEKELKDGADPNLILPTEGIAPLHYAVGMASSKSLFFTKMLLGFGADPNIRSVDGLTPVHIAATWGRIQALQYLLASGGDPGLTDEEGQTALAMAESCEKWDCVDLLLPQTEADHADVHEDEPDSSIVYTRLSTSSIQRTNPQDAANTLLEDYSSSVLMDISKDYDNSPVDHATTVFQNLRNSNQGIMARLSVSEEHGNSPVASVISEDNYNCSFVVDDSGDHKGATLDYTNSEVLEEDLQFSGHGNCLLPEAGGVQSLQDGDSKIIHHTDHSESVISPTHSQLSGYRESQPLLDGDSKITNHADHSKSVISPTHSQLSGYSESRPFLDGDSKITNHADHSASVISPTHSHLSGYGDSDWRLGLEDSVVDPSRLNPGRDHVPAVSGILKGNNDKRQRRKMRVSFFQSSEEVATERKEWVPSEDELNHEEREQLEQSQEAEEGEDTIGEDYSYQDFTILEGQGLDVTSPDNTIVFRKRASRDKRKTCLFEVIGSPYLSPADCSIHSDKDGDTSQTLKEACTLLEKLVIDSRPVDVLERVKGIAQSLRSGEPSPTSSVASVNAIPGAVCDPVTESSPSLSSEATPTRKGDSKRYVPRSEKKCRSSMFHHLSPVQDNNLRTADEDEVIEEYFYYDREANAGLIERNLPSANCSMMRTSSSNHSSGHDRLFQSADSSVAGDSTRSGDETNLYDWKSFVSEDSDALEPEPILDEVRSLSNTEVQARLRALGEEPGPVTGTTRRVYLILLSKLIRDPERKQQKEAPQSSFRHELAQVLSGSRPLEDLSVMEAEMVVQFMTPDPRRKWREGVLKSSFNYLLLDPRVSLNLPMRHTLLSELEAFRVFVSAVFYVGKGKRSRPYCHFYEALSEVKEGKKKKKKGPGKKVQHIRDIWSAGLGVISLHIFQNTIPVEAYTREACMVEALTLQRLTNVKKGDYYSVASTWDARKKRSMGVHLLHKAQNIFLIEGERMIRPADIKIGQ